MNLTAAGLIVGLLLFAPAAMGQPLAGDPAAGRQLARERCSGCHALEPRPGDRGMSFAAIANMASTTSLSLRAFLLTPHPTMPNFRLAPREIDDIVAFILSLRR